jgi:DNA-binding GntR family transcriptional regulator
MRLPPITPELPASNRPFSRSIRSPRMPASYAAFRLFYGEAPPTLSIKDQVAVAVAERIIDGRFAPGERIPEQLLADEFNVSKAPVSEALMLLEYVGLVESAARRSAFVPLLTAQDFGELTEYRNTLTRLSLDRFFDRHTPTDRQVLRDYLTAIEALVSDDGRAFDFVEMFDRATLYIIVQGGNQHIARAMFSVSLQILRYFRIGTQSLKHRRAVLATWNQASAALDARNREKFLAGCREIQEMRYEETLAALKAAA